MISVDYVIEVTKKENLEDGVIKVFIIKAETVQKTKKELGVDVFNEVLKRVGEVEVIGLAAVVWFEANVRAV